ncbi:DUF7282 domain-containing protein [Halobacterium litoreum]|uniref:DUF7282 domain-containing protein n=1 Tax=Halobacterium litoreum TaxID=2039234 RepID=A0ABD5NFP8_9EURY|nr:hypothetical protein [Halobacterium litoreum]UHH13165.1 hypothetical protein LT972_13535 [Halobacterium litoreum]
MNVRRLAVIAVVGALVLWGGATAATASHATATTDTTVDATTATVQEANATVAFDDQTVEDGTVTVRNVTLPEGGYVTIHDDTLFEGDALGSVVGVSEYLDAGTHENVTVTLYEGVSGADFENATPPNGSEVLVAMPHLETGDDETYDFVATNGSEDGPYTTGGQAVVDSAKVTFGDAEETRTRGIVVSNLVAPNYAAPNSTVTVEATLVNEDPAERTEDVAFRLEGGSVDVVVHERVTVPANNETTVTFEVDTTGVPTDEYIHGVTTYNSSEFATITVTENAQVDIDEQETNGSTVTVDEAYLPEGGYVTIHDSSLLDGEVTGSVVGVSEYLEPGHYENVEVTLDEAMAEDDTLIAMPHLETTDDETYDFVDSEGEDDGPYVTNGQPVTDAANVTVA